LTARHPARADLRVQMHADLVLIDRRLVCRQFGQQSANPPQFRGVLRVARPDHRPWATPNELDPMQFAPDRLGAETQTLLFPKQHGQKSTRPTRPEEAEVSRRALQQPMDHDDEPMGDCHWPRFATQCLGQREWKVLDKVTLSHREQDVALGTGQRGCRNLGGVGPRPDRRNSGESDEAKGQAEAGQDRLFVRPFDFLLRSIPHDSEKANLNADTLLARLSQVAPN